MEGSDPRTCGVVAMQIFPSRHCTLHVKAKESSRILAVNPKVGRCGKRQDFRYKKCELGEDHDLFELCFVHRPPRPELQQKLSSKI